MSKYTHIFFDLDRTLWDFDTNSTITFKEIFSKYNLKGYFKDFETFHKIYTKINLSLWSDYRNNLISKEDLSWQRFYKTLETARLDDISTAKSIAQDYIQLSPNKTALYPHTNEVLQYLSKKYKLFIVTNGFKEVQHKKIINCELDKYFDAVYTSEEIGYNKPHKEFFDFVIKDSGAKTEQSIVIGDDTEIDILGAKNAFIDSIWFNPRNENGNTLPDYEINSLEELLNIL